MKKVQTHDHFQKRRAGILLHPTSVKVDVGQGPLGKAATPVINFLANAGFSIWQMLPVQAVDKFGSPYQCISAHAGNPALICQQKLLANSWMTAGELSADIDFTEAGIDIINEALLLFEAHATDAQRSEYTKFKNDHLYWLDDYALYCVIKALHKGDPWWMWPHEFRYRNNGAMLTFRSKQINQIERYQFEQFIFFSQWRDIRKLAVDNNIMLFGDLPIFVAHDSVDVWVHPGYFQLDENDQPVVVAGVPPDYFSATGQRWGNPLYNWAELGRDDYQWWIERLRTQLELFDIVRMDHFRGYEATWEIPVSCTTAVEGEWVQVPGYQLFNALHDEFGDLPLIAEDLGTISAEVNKLRDDFKLPGMKVMQFAFDSDAANPYLPHNHLPVSLVCTGTHDNNTSKGWFDNLDDSVRTRVMDYLQNETEPMPWPLIRATLASVGCYAILPMQDLLSLDGSHRMNTPGTMDGNWSWQFEWDWVSVELPKRLKHLNELYGRC